MAEPEVIWMEVTVDEYELPVAVAGSAEELTQMSGVKRKTIIDYMSRYKAGKRKSCKYLKVILEDDE